MHSIIQRKKNGIVEYFLITEKYGIAQKSILVEESIKPLLSVLHRKLENGKEQKPRFEVLVSKRGWMEVDYMASATHAGSIVSFCISREFDSYQARTQKVYEWRDIYPVFYYPPYEDHPPYRGIKGLITEYNRENGVFTFNGEFQLGAKELGGYAVAKLARIWKEKEQEEATQRLIEEREIYQEAARPGFYRVNIGEYSYPLVVPYGDKNQENCGDAFGGYSSNDPVLHAWLLAAQEMEVPSRYAWSGIMDSMGSHASVSPPWKPGPKNHLR